MGKAARAACIFVPMALTIASLVCLVIIEVSGWGGSHGQLNSYYFLQADFTNLTVSSAGTFDNTTALTDSLSYAQENHLLAEIYQIHLWNYCSSNSSSGSIDYCSPRHSDFYFNPITAWSLNSTNATSSDGSSSDNPVGQEIDQLKNNTEALENTLLGKTGEDALNAYRDAAKWMFIAYEISFWTTLATIIVGILAIFSRWGSFLTWILAGVSTLFTIAAVATSTALFIVLEGALKTLLDPYKVSISLGTHALEVTWLAVVFNVAGTLFWLFSICCCAGSSNPHHRSNKGGLWNAERKGQGYGAEDFAYPGGGGAAGGAGFWNRFSGGGGAGGSGARGRGLRVEKTGGGGGGAGYERVGSPIWGGGEQYGDRVPLADYPQQQTGFAPAGGDGRAYEPFRHG